MLGLDGHGPDVFDRVYDFAMRTSLYDVQITVMTPFPGTPLYQRLLAEGRLIDPRAWHKCTLFDVNFKPLHMTPDELRAGLLRLAGRLYHPDAVRARREAFFAGRHRGTRKGRPPAREKNQFGAVGPGLSAALAGRGLRDKIHIPRPPGVTP